MYQQPPPSPHAAPLYGSYPQGAPQGAPVYVQQQQAPMMMQSPAPVAYMPMPPLNDDPTMIICPSCRNQVTTRTKPEIGTCTWLSCLGMGSMTCCLCCCIPFFFDIFKDVNHTCPSCNSNLGTFKRTC